MTDNLLTLLTDWNRSVPLALIGITLFVIFRTARGLKTNLYLEHVEPGSEHPSMIPVNSVDRQAGSISSLWNRRGNEDVELRLRGNAARSLKFQVDFRIFRWFLITLVDNDSGVEFNHKPMKPQKRYPLRQGSSLKIDGREYKAVLTRTKPIDLLERDLFTRAK